MLQQILIFSLLTIGIESLLPTFSAKNRQICDGFKHNWAAEIRCLREIVEERPELASLERKERSLTGEVQPQPQPRRNFIRPPSRTTVRREPDACFCNDEKLEKLKEHFEKKLYEVKMKAAYDNEMGIAEMQKKIDSEIKSFQGITNSHIGSLERKLDYFEAPRITNNNKEFFLVKREESWYTASEKCISYGGQLASIHSRLDNSLIGSLIPKNSTAWIGVNDVQKENKFQNRDGSEVGFYRWAQGQPNNEEHNENCVEIDYRGFWNDKLCIIARPFICEKRMN